MDISSHSEAFHLFHCAILEHRQAVCLYKGYRREVCPYILGHSAGDEKALVFQFAGEGRSTLPAGGDWCCLFLSEVREAVMREGRWYGAAKHRTRQRWVEQVYIDVNTDVPNQPGRT